MPKDTKKYTFETTKVIDGKEYVEVEEVTKLLENLETVNKSVGEFEKAVNQLKELVGGMQL